MFRAVVLLSVILLGVFSAHADDESSQCDRSGDSKVTTLDALMALQEAVDTCRLGYECDANGDYDATASDALALLRFAVDLPVQLDCTCIDIDECFGDADCVVGYPPNYHCSYYLCVRCEQDSDCDEGEVCDLCSYDCVPASQ
jgi:hypothetical protein